MLIAPVAVFAFNRSDLLLRTLAALAANDLAKESDITVFCDGPRHDEEKKATDGVRAVAHAAQGFASVHVVERQRNMGCAASIIDGLTYMFALHERLIVIEDDIICSPYTLAFLNAGLEFYATDSRVFNISAWSPPPSLLRIPSDYLHDVYAVPRFNCWGWASWRNRFQDIDWTVADYGDFKSSSSLRKAFDAGGGDMSAMLDAQMEGRIDSWAIRADYARFKKGQVGINPVKSYTTNIGMDSGTHCTEATGKFDNDLSIASQKAEFIASIAYDKRIIKRYRCIYSGLSGNFFYDMGMRIYRYFPSNIKMLVKFLWRMYK